MNNKFKDDSVLIIVCAYNEEENIAITLKSIAESILKSGSVNRFKLVCVDNSSSDNTWDLARGFSVPKISYDYIKIEHCPLCVSRNIYKFYSGFDYYSYIDADGGVDINWAKNLLKTLDNHKPDVLGGPVLPLVGREEASILWEVFYDSFLYGEDSYLIGANMCFSSSFLREIDGFPQVFSSRGDETCLLLKAKLLGQESKIYHCENITAYNHFPTSRYSFLKEQFGDGVRSSQIVRLWGKRSSCIFNLTFRLTRLLCFVCSLALIVIDLRAAAYVFLVSICLSIIKRPLFIYRLFLKVFRKSNSATLFDGVIVMLSFYIFDLGFIKSFFSKNTIAKESVFSTSIPLVLAKND